MSAHGFLILHMHPRPFFPLSFLIYLYLPTIYMDSFRDFYITLFKENSSFPALKPFLLALCPPVKVQQRVHVSEQVSNPVHSPAWCTESSSKALRAHHLACLQFYLPPPSPLPWFELGCLCLHVPCSSPSNHCLWPLHCLYSPCAFSTL